jgi:predicted transposase/invertase (TIGR01784 family)
VLIDKLSFTFIELPKFKKEIQKNSSHQDKWLYLISKLEELDETPQELDEKIYHDFIHKAQVTALNKKEFDNYQASLKRYRDNYAIEKHKLDEAEAIGVAKGIEQGIEKGEHVKALQIAKSMKLKGYDINLIIDLTGLSKNDIDSI